MTKFYTVMFNIAGMPATIQPTIEATLDKSVADWLRFGRLQYIVKCDLTAKQIYLNLKPLIPADGHMLVMSANLSDRHGFASKLAVDWLRKNAP